MLALKGNKSIPYITVFTAQSSTSHIMVWLEPHVFLVTWTGILEPLKAFETANKPHSESTHWLGRLCSFVMSVWFSMCHLCLCLFTFFYSVADYNEDNLL